MGAGHAFRFGVQASTARTGAEWAEQARKIEGLGYSTLFMPDHFVDTDLAPMVALPFAAAEFTVQPDEQLVLVTDGLTETRDRAGKMLGADGAMELIGKSSSDPQTCADQLAAAARRRSRGSLQDDLAVLVIGFDRSP